MSIFSDRLILLMKKHRINQKELAQRTGVTESAMSYYVNGDRTPRSDVLTRMAKTLGTTTDYLLGRSDCNFEESNDELQYLQRNLGKLDAKQIKKAEKILKEVFEDIFDDISNDEEWYDWIKKESRIFQKHIQRQMNY